MIGDREKEQVIFLCSSILMHDILTCYKIYIHSMLQSSFSLGLVYNYGTHSYQMGNDMRYLAVWDDCYVGSSQQVTVCLLLFTE